MADYNKFSPRDLKKKEKTFETRLKDQEIIWHDSGLRLSSSEIKKDVTELVAESEAFCDEYIHYYIETFIFVNKSHIRSLSTIKWHPKINQCSGTWKSTLRLFIPLLTLLEPYNT